MFLLTAKKLRISKTNGFFLVKNWHVYLKNPPPQLDRKNPCVCRLFLKKKGFFSSLHLHTVLFTSSVFLSTTLPTHILFTYHWCWDRLTERTNIFGNTNEMVPMRVLIFVYGLVLSHPLTAKLNNSIILVAVQCTRYITCVTHIARIHPHVCESVY